MRDFVLLYINGKRTEVRGAQAFLMLSDFLRYEKRQTGTKIVCAEGDCGACTVLKAGPRSPNFQAINSCIVPVALLDGCQLVSVEGLRENGELNELQQAMVKSHGAQCGFCTPGFMMALTHLFEKQVLAGKRVDEKTVKNHLTGNLCRCTGYAPIIEAALAVDGSKLRSMKERYARPEIARDLQKHFKKPVFIEAEGKIFHSPTKVSDCVAFMARNREARIFSSATDLGVPMNKGRIAPRVFLGLNQMPELYRVKKSPKRIYVGAKTTLDELERLVEDVIPELAGMLRVFASPQIKNAATLAGNVANGSPIGDTLPFLLVADAVVHAYGRRGPRKIPFSEFYLGYRKTALKPDEIIVGIEFAVPSKEDRLRLFKVAQRKDLDISCVNAGFRLTWKNGKITRARVAFGGVGPTVLALKETEAFLQGKTLEPDVIQGALEKIESEISPRSDVRGSADYRLKLSQNLFRKFAEEMKAEVRAEMKAELGGRA